MAARLAPLQPFVFATNVWLILTSKEPQRTTQFTTERDHITMVWKRNFDWRPWHPNSSQCNILDANRLQSAG
jgi:hypothetical protein